ncbi:Type I restriction modification DNA specificity domain protein [compost metagenome]
MASLNQATIGRLPIALPTRHEQTKVADLLEALDNRITLLRETNSTLEAIAQALFKSWFVDFDPVRAKAEGLEPEGMDAATAALFPDSFEESELGLVPRGWTEVPLGQLCFFQKGCSYKGDGLSDDHGAYMFNLGCFNAPRIFAFEKVKRYTGEFRDKHRVSGGDLIIANTDMTQHRAILGRPLLVPDGVSPSFVSHHVFKVVINNAYDTEIKHFLFFCFLQPSFRERAVGYATGTTVLALPKDALEQHLIRLPDHELIKTFADYCEPIFSSIQANEVQAKNLTQLRDTLLPRLISGQLRLPESEVMVEEVCA